MDYRVYNLVMNKKQSSIFDSINGTWIYIIILIIALLLFSGGGSSGDTESMDYCDQHICR